MSFNLRPYQTDARQQINRLLNAGRNPIYCAPTGTGKTKTASAIVADRVNIGQRVFILCPQEEIFHQWQIAFAESGIDAGYINSDGVQGRNKKVYICMPMSLNNILSLLPEKFKPDLIITDECFVKGTKILTSRGNINIENIKPYDKIFTYNEKKLEVELKQVNSLFIKKIEKPIMRIKFQNGIKIKCTYDHLFYTNNGWKKAIDINKSVDMVRLINNNVTRGNKNELLYMQQGNTESNKTSEIFIQEKWKSILFYRVFKRILPQNIFGNNVQNKQEICKCENEKEKSNVQKRDTRESKPNTQENRTQAKDSGRKRKRETESPNSTCQKIREEMENGIPRKNWQEKIQRLSNLLQIRYCESYSKNRDRSGWKFTLFGRTSSPRQEERESLTWLRLESLKIQKQGSFIRFKFLHKFSQNHVYDLNVQDNHNYFANNILVHNCHHSLADTWLNIYDFYSDAQRLGLTATPQRLDGKGLDNVYTDIVQTIDMKGAIEAGYLAKPLTIIPEQYHLKIQINNGDYDIYQQAEQLGKVQIIGDVIKQYTNIFAGLPVIVACSTSEHANIMTKSFREAGWKFDHIHSNLNKHERRRIIREIRQRKLNGLCTCGIGTEGLDIPGLYGLIWLRRTLSVTIFLQFIGRVLRPLPGKQYGIIIDPVGNTFIHGRPEMHREWKLTGRDDEPNTEESAPKMKICPICSVMNAEENITCHICGYDFRSGIIPDGKKRKLPVMIDGKLIILDADKLADRKEAIQESLREQRKKMSEPKEEIRPVTKLEKIRILKNGLESKSNLFSEAIKNYL